MDSILIWGTYYDLLFMFQVGIGMYIHKFPGFHTFHMEDFVHQKFVQKRPQVPPHCPWRPFFLGGEVLVGHHEVVKCCF